MAITIKNIKSICTAPAGINLIVVKVETSEPGLYGLGCSTFAYRHHAVASVIDQYLHPLLQGRDAANIEDIFKLMTVNAYWRNGPVSNNAISGVDMALWDIKGKLAGMPLYQLFGGKCREAVPIYRHTDGTTFEHVQEQVLKYMEQGVRHIRCQFGGYGGKSVRELAPKGSADGVYFDPDKYSRETVQLFEYMRKHVGYEVELLHDVHERLAPIEAVRLAKYLEPYRLFFLEDALPPEQGEWFQNIRSQTSTPIAQGELFNHPLEWRYLITERLIDFIRVHISQIGGITPARKLAIFCEQFGIRTAWHGPGDVSPVGHAANIHLDLSTPNFGIQEWSGINDVLHEVFPGSPVLKGGLVYANDKPGLGIDINEQLAEKYPCSDDVTVWTQTRLPDGSIACP